jgi:hypothetical protein
LSDAAAIFLRAKPDSPARFSASKARYERRSAVKNSSKIPAKDFKKIWQKLQKNLISKMS